LEASSAILRFSATSWDISPLRGGKEAAKAPTLFAKILYLAWIRMASASDE
jgi:hypothetical protein